MLIFYFFESFYAIMVKRGEKMRIDEEFMEEVGLGAMPEEEKKAFMQHAEEELEVRVGQGVGADLTDEQMREFDQITDLDAAIDWLEQNAPNFRETVAHIYENFKQELINERQSILGL